jgi:hypothetical protein
MIRKIALALVIPLVMVGIVACGPQQGCFDDDGEQYSCNQQQDDDDFEGDDD